MRFTLRHGIVAASFTVGLLTACASETPPVGNDPLDATTGTDAVSTTPQDSGGTTTPKDSGTKLVCKSGCTTDAECQSTCPPAAGGNVNCCDKGSGVCFAAPTCQQSSGGDAGTD